jgi:hypothetical protein
MDGFSGGLVHKSPIELGAFAVGFAKLVGLEIELSPDLRGEKERAACLISPTRPPVRASLQE